MLDPYVEKTKIIILDTCRTKKGSRGGGYDFSSMIAPRGSIIAFSTSPGQEAKEDKGHGVYTRILLEHLEDPRVSIETVFKRVRMDLAMETHGTQTSWEHTSLIGDFQLNPNTIYDGWNYSEDAIADGEYVFDRNSDVTSIVEGLKSHSWPAQGTAINKIRAIDFRIVRADDLFVLGRNIYQAACGNSFVAQGFIDSISNYQYIPVEAKGHLITGMAFEIYYDHEGKLRKNLKWQYAEEVVKLLETDAFFGSCEFISIRLFNEESRVFYIPGQDDKVKVQVKVQPFNDNAEVLDILHNGVSIYYNPHNNEKPKVSDFNVEKTKSQFEAELRKKMAVMPGYLKIGYSGMEINNKTKLLLPFNGYNLFPRDD